MDLETGHAGTINAAFKTVRLVNAAGYSETSKLEPAKGMILSYNGKKAVITSVKKDGVVAIKQAGQPVQKLAPDDPSLDTLFNPEDWEIGETVNIGSMSEGDMFQGGRGKILRPYVVLGVEGNKIQWQNLETGQKGLALKGKKVKQLEPTKGSPAEADKKPDPAPLSSYVTAISAELHPRVAQTLAQLVGTDRQLLALRSYLRSAPPLADRWSWTQEQIEAFEGSPEQRDLQQEVDRVRTAFVAATPGFELYVNSEVLSLDVQIEHWNSNESVTAAAREILTALQALILAPGFPANRPEQARETLKAFLSGYKPVPTPTIAAPGLSLHGQMRAIDFQVHQGGRVVAGPSTATIATDWAAGGWAAKLDAAVREASNRFVGPQATPPAPWHYTYVPEEMARD